jgi:hypothetical protein
MDPHILVFVTNTKPNEKRAALARAGYEPKQPHAQLKTRPSYAPPAMAVGRG